MYYCLSFLRLRQMTTGSWRTAVVGVCCVWCVVKAVVSSFTDLVLASSLCQRQRRHATGENHGQLQTCLKSSHHLNGGPVPRCRNLRRRRSAILQHVPAHAAFVPAAFAFVCVWTSTNDAGKESISTNMPPLIYATLCGSL